ncbi:hypothetical protein CK203_063229 [Vitis vinifera]|uniref:Uncharacterized protein n=1 Tax=Vitis vinifera TaxID=29760 RepID=A0A438FSZ2_VITVI|nr:hypothetical protein CK203_063229 [Vitis vinifera]
MQNDLSQKIDNLQYSISRLTNLNTVQEKGRFPSQPHQNPKGIHEVETHEGESSQVRDVKALITLRSEILEVLRQVKVNIPLLDMIKQVPTYAKFLKNLCTIKRGLNVNKKAFLTEQVISCYFKCDLNCRNGLMQLTFGNMTLEFNIFHISKKQITPEEEKGPEEDLEEGLSEPADVLATLQGWTRNQEILPLFDKEEGQDDVTEEFPMLNLKPLPWS